jgi:hypothetical protein
MSNISKKDMERLIESEVDKALLDENLGDWLKRGVQAVSSAWEAAKGKLTGAAKNVKTVLQQKLAQVKQAYPQALQQYKELKAIEAQSGEKLPADKTIQIAQQLPESGKAAIAEVQGEQQAVQGAASQINQQAQSQAQEAYVVYATELLEETSRQYETSNKQYLSESGLLKEIDPFGVVGLGLGAIGGLPMLVKGLYKFAKFLKLTQTAALLEKVHHVLHQVEEKAIDYIVPDKLSYMWYKKKYGITRAVGQAPALPYEEYKKSAVRKKVEKQIYVILLIPFLLSGITAVSHAGASLIGAAEGTATTVKAVEIGNEILALASSFGKA